MQVQAKVEGKVNFTKVFMPRQVPCVRPASQPGREVQRMPASSPSRRES